MPAYNKPVRIHCKAGSVSVRFVFETRAKCQDFVARKEDDGIPYEINSPFCCAKQQLRCVNPNQLKTGRSGKPFAPLWRELAEQLKIFFPDGDDEGGFAHESSAFKNSKSNTLFGKFSCSHFSQMYVDEANAWRKTWRRR